MNHINLLLAQLQKDPKNKTLIKQLQKRILKEHSTTIYQSIKPQMGGFIEQDSISLSILNTSKHNEALHLKCSVFFEEKIGGCNCHDDPHSENGYIEQNYCLTTRELHLI